MVCLEVVNVLGVPFQSHKQNMINMFSTVYTWQWWVKQTDDSIDFPKAQPSCAAKVLLCIHSLNMYHIRFIFYQLKKSTLCIIWWRLFVRNSLEPRGPSWSHMLSQNHIIFKHSILTFRHRENTVVVTQTLMNQQCNLYTPQRNQLKSQANTING